MFAQSGLQGRMSQLHQLCGQSYLIYGDSAYALSQYVVPAFKGLLSANQRAMNAQMAHVRISVEWSFAIQMQQWAYLGDQRHLKLREQPITKLYVVGALLHNLHCIAFKGNLISKYFDCWPAADLTMHSYLH